MCISPLCALSITVFPLHTVSIIFLCLLFNFSSVKSSIHSDTCRLHSLSFLISSNAFNCTSPRDCSTVSVANFKLEKLCLFFCTALIIWEFISNVKTLSIFLTIKQRLLFKYGHFCGFSTWNLFHVTFLAPRILKLFTDFWTDFYLPCLKLSGPHNSVGIATDNGLDGPGSNPGGDEIFRPSRPVLGSTQPPVKWVPGSFPAVKCGRSVLLTTHPPSSAAVMEQ